MLVQPLVASSASPAYKWLSALGAFTLGERPWPALMAGKHMENAEQLSVEVNFELQVVSFPAEQILSYFTGYRGNILSCA